MFYAQPVCSKYFDISFFVCMENACKQYQQKMGAALCRAYSGLELKWHAHTQIEPRTENSVEFHMLLYQNCTTKMATSVCTLTVDYYCCFCCNGICTNDLGCRSTSSIETVVVDHKHIFFLLHSSPVGLLYFRIAVGYTAANGSSEFYAFVL